jgi:hypothetical protein
MSRYTIVYPENGPSYYKGSDAPPGPQPSRGATILPDLPDFVSPIDGKLYSGRAGLRDHCARHDVVPTADLKGLPYLTTTSDTRSTEQKRADADHRKKVVIQEVDKQYRRYNG